jgi:hypothetical protein
MKREALILRSYDRDVPDRVVEVEYVPRSHWDTTADLKAYDVVVDGVKAGHVEQVVANTHAKIAGSRLVRSLKGTVEWAWRGTDGRQNMAGLYCRTRRDAVAEILRYRYAEKA